MARGKEGNRRAEQKDRRNEERVKEREKGGTNGKEERGEGDYVARERRRARMHLLFVGKGPLGGAPLKRGLSYKRPMGAPNRTHESQKAESCR